MSLSPSEDQLLPTTEHLMPVEAMKAVIWVGFALCFIGFCARSYIRWICFRRLLPEDWIMMVALGIQLAAACVAQLRLHYVYMLEDVSNGSIPMPSTFLEDVPKALHGIFIQGILSITGVHAVKLSFLLFFHRLGRQIPKYILFWWFVAFVTLASYGISIALIEYKCMLSSLEVIFFECTANGETARQWTYMVAYCTIDAASDLLILCLPIVILWKVRLTMRKKLILGAIFSLTLITVAVTIIRGTIHMGKVVTDGSQTQNIAWAWFWLSIEFIMAYIISCLVSFRMLFVHNERSSSARAAAAHHKQQQQQQQEKYRLSPPGRPSDSKPSRKRFLDTLLDTFHDWEGTTRHSGGGRFLDGTLPSGRMSVDFMHYATGQSVDDDGVYHALGDKSIRTTSSASDGGGGGGEDERPDSAKTLTTGHIYEVAQVARPVSARIVVHGNQSQDMGFRFDFGQPGGML
ncbi:hypothetical protein B0I37DRAFT_150748 [Chaetomium sp. MPI-CAGE-AT-0009]|nr:hypothetical protein B0I37DRAFT_150748 [Chaetomium sp. MPI-CAGE-AT-0009]